MINVLPKWNGSSQSIIVAAAYSFRLLFDLGFNKVFDGKVLKLMYLVSSELPSDSQSI